MTLPHEQAHDLLEGYALWSLDDRERRAVERHLAECTECAATARELERVVAAIPESLGGRAPSAKLRERVLAAARGERAPTRRTWFRRPRPVTALSLALVIVALALGGVAVRLQQDVVRLTAERDLLRAVALNVSEGARWWYMTGSDDFAGSEGALIDPKDPVGAYVLFHDLKPITSDQRYAVWLIRGDGRWVRAANFRPSGDEIQRVDVPLAVADFVQCAVTVEMSDTGARRGPVAMQSRVFAQ
jgi:hypothetical protein